MVRERDERHEVLPGLEARTRAVPEEDVSDAPTVAGYIHEDGLIPEPDEVVRAIERDAKLNKSRRSGALDPHFRRF